MVQVSASVFMIWFLHLRCSRNIEILCIRGLVYWYTFKKFPLSWMRNMTSCTISENYVISVTSLNPSLTGLLQLLLTYHHNLLMSIISHLELAWWLTDNNLQGLFYEEVKQMFEITFKKEKPLNVSQLFLVEWFIIYQTNKILIVLTCWLFLTNSCWLNHTHTVLYYTITTEFINKKKLVMS